LKAETIIAGYVKFNTAEVDLNISFIENQTSNLGKNRLIQVQFKKSATWLSESLWDNGIVGENPEPYTHKKYFMLPKRNVGSPVPHLSN
jgi:hypothetical protein